MADGVNWASDPSGALPAKTMLQNFAGVASKADFANFHLYMSPSCCGSYAAFTGFITSVLADYGNLLAGKKVIITEFGYDQDSDLQGSAPKDQLINTIRSFVSSNSSLIAGSSYWMDIGNAWQKNVSNAGGNAFLLSAPLVPFDLSGACPTGAYCPFVQTCSFSSYTCPDYSETGNAWAYKPNSTFYNQF